MKLRYAFYARAAGKSRRILGVVLCGLLASAAWGAADPAAPNPGLQGLLPEEPPATVTDALAGLPPSWQAWSEQVAADLTQLYTGNLDLAGQRQVLGRLQAQLAVIDKALADPRYAKIHDRLREIAGALTRHIEILGATLDLLTSNPASGQAARLQSAKADVAQAATQAEAKLNTVKNGGAWVAYLHLPQVVQAAEPAADPQAAVAAARDVQTQLQAAAQSPAMQAFLSRPEIQQLGHATGNLLAAADQPATAPTADAVRDALKALLTSLDQYEATGSDAAAAQARGAFETLRRLIPDAATELAAALQRNYFNYNFRMAATEAFLNRVLSERRDEQGAVRDCVLGADVYGWQYTSTSAAFDLLPCSQNARFAVTLNGQVNSNTEGITRQATVFTQGNHSFYARKEIDFDGNQFATLPATISVNANNTTTGAQTKVSRLPLVGRVADRYAVNAAERKRPESEAIAASRISDRVVPELNKEVNKQFGKANVQFTKTENALKDANLYPDARYIRTTGEELLVRTRLMNPGELGGGMPPLHSAPAGGLLVQVHESLINHSLDELNVSGRTMTEDDLRKLLEERLSKLLDRQVTLKAEEPATPAPAAGEEASSEPKAMIFAAQNPLRVRLAGSQVIITLRAGFKREGRDDIPEQIVTIPLNFAVEGSQIVASHGDIAVEPAQQAANVAEQIALAGVVRRKIESALPVRKFDRALNIQRDNGSPIRASLAELKAIDGWLELILE
jgi:hypothetical protein